MARLPRTAAIALVAALSLTGCTGDGPDEQAAPSATPTPLAELNTAAFHLPRADFCAVVPDEAVVRALGGAGDGSAWRDGEEAEIAPERRDVTHEFGCTWTRDGVTASAWVFAQAADAATARLAIRDARRTEACRTTNDAFGDRGVRQACDEATGEVPVRVRHAGLFDDTWFTCEVADRGEGASAARLSERADAWCADVVSALNTQE